MREGVHLKLLWATLRSIDKHRLLRGDTAIARRGIQCAAATFVIELETLHGCRLIVGSLQSEHRRGALHTNIHLHHTAADNYRTVIIEGVSEPCAARRAGI